MPTPPQALPLTHRGASHSLSLSLSFLFCQMGELGEMVSDARLCFSRESEVKHLSSVPGTQ